MVLFYLSIFANIKNHRRSSVPIFHLENSCHVIYLTIYQSLQSEKHMEEGKWGQEVGEKTQWPQFTASSFHTHGNWRPRQCRHQSGSVHAASLWPEGHVAQERSQAATSASCVTLAKSLNLFEDGGWNNWIAFVRHPAESLTQQAFKNGNASPKCNLNQSTICGIAS